MTFLQQLNIFTGMALLWCNKLNPAMAMVMVIPLDKFLHPQARVLQAGKAF